LKPLIKQIKELSKASIVVHHDRDYMEQDEIEIWKKEIIGAGAEPFVTLEIDVEGYFATEEYICLVGNGVPAFELQAVKRKLAEDVSSSLFCGPTMLAIGGFLFGGYVFG
jgi:hypothetical protein